MSDNFIICFIAKKDVIGTKQFFDLTLRSSRKLARNTDCVASVIARPAYLENFVSTLIGMKDLS